MIQGKFILNPFWPFWLGLIFIHSVCFAQPASSFIPLDDFIHTVAEMKSADLDNDGDNDFIFSSYALNRIAWKENDGTGHFTVQHLIGRVAGQYCDFDLADINLDGLIDIVALSDTSGFIFDDTHSICAYTNLGGGIFSEPEIITFPGYHFRNLVLIDADEDGLPDVIACYEIDGNHIGLFRNIAGSFSPPEIITENMNDDVYVSDMNGDILPDVLSYDSDNIYLSFNLGYGVFGPRQSIYVSNVALNHKLTIIEGNGDGFPDLVLNNIYDNELIYLVNQGDGSFSLPILLATNSNNFPAYGIDYDLDGDEDLLHPRSNCCSNGTPCRCTYNLFTNDGNGSFDFEMNFTGYWGGPTDVVIEDFNGDSYPDFVTSDGVRATAMFENLQNGSFDAPRPINSIQYQISSIRTGDYDGDGDQDVVHGVSGFLTCEGSRLPAVAWYENLGNAQFSAQHVIAQSGVEKEERLLVTDFDNDEIDDVIWLENDSIRWSKYFDGSDDINFFVSRHGGEEISAADFNNDGNVDIALADSDDNRITIYYSDGNGAPIDTLIAASGLMVDPRLIRSKDMDNDGDVDFVFHSVGNGRLYYCRNNLTGFTKYSISTSESDLMNLGILDVDLDGILDIVLVKGYQLNWYKFNGSTSFIAQGLMVPDAYTVVDSPLHIADLDLDGIDDVLFINQGSYQSEVTTLMHTGPSEFESFAGDNLYSMELITTGDLDEDGLPDILVSRSHQPAIEWTANLNGGCTDPAGCNYDPNALPGGNCVYPGLADFNCSLTVDVQDLIILISVYGCIDDCAPYDLNGDGLVGASDIIIFMGLCQ